jgi:tetratricopeptide (TPR) repeat protein
VTYPDPAVISAVAERFVPLRLDLFRDRAAVRPLNVIWTPTLLFADRRGTVHYESLNFLPPADFLDLLDIGEACVRQRWGEYDRAITLFAAVTDRNPDAPFAAEALYRRGIAIYLKSRSNREMYAVWQELIDRFPDSIWARRIP